MSKSASNNDEGQISRCPGGRRFEGISIVGIFIGRDSADRRAVSASLCILARSAVALRHSSQMPSKKASRLCGRQFAGGDGRKYLSVGSDEFSIVLARAAENGFAQGAIEHSLIGDRTFLATYSKSDVAC